nr:MAG: hypothetical protein [Lake Baikal virophage 9]
MDNKQYKTSELRRAYQRDYYKLRQNKLIQQEKEKKVTGGDILKKKLNDDSSDSDDSVDSKRKQPSSSSIDKVTPKVDKEKIVNFKLKHAISYIEKNINKNAEDYIMDLSEELGYNIESTDGCYEFLKILEKYLNKTF